jgi:hypothetical protein
MTMTRLLNLFRCAPARRPHRFRPGLEQLEDRLVPSVSSGSAFDVSSLSSAGQSTDAGRRCVARSDSGNFAAVWSDGGVNVRLFDRSGTPLTGAFGLDSLGAQPTVAMSGNGSFLVAWTHYYSSSDWDVYAQRFDATGRVVGGRSYVAGSTQKEYEPSVAMDGSGNFVVAYTYQYSATDKDVYAARYNAAGSLQQRITVAASTQNEWQPSVAMNGSGAFVVAYTYAYSSSDWDVYAQRFDATGNGRGSATAVATSTRMECEPSVGIDGAGNVAVAFTSTYDALNRDNDVYVRRYDANGSYLAQITVASSGQDESGPSLSMAANGNFAVTFTTTLDGSLSSNTGVRLNYYTASGVFWYTTSVASGGSRGYDASVALDSFGNVAVVWTDLGAKSPYGTGVFYRVYRMA